MQISSTTLCTHRVHLIIYQFEDLLLIMPGITILDLLNSKIKHTASHCFINETGQIPFLATIAARKIRTVRSVSSGIDRFHRVMT